MFLLMELVHQIAVVWQLRSWVLTVLVPSLILLIETVQHQLYPESPVFEHTLDLSISKVGILNTSALIKLCNTFPNSIANKRFEKAERGGWNRGPRQKDILTGMRDRAQQNIENASYWIDQDFTNTRILSAQELFGDYKTCVRSVGSVGGDSATVRYPAFQAATIEADPPSNETENVETQDAILGETYKEYVDDHTNAAVVEEWTREAEEDGYAPPHQIMEEMLLMKAGVYDNVNDRNINIWTYDKKEVQESINRLYELVTQAPRCPKMMSFVRSVRRQSRLPHAWFWRLTNPNRHMKTVQNLNPKL